MNVELILYIVHVHMLYHLTIACTACINISISLDKSIFSGLVKIFSYADRLLQSADPTPSPSQAQPSEYYSEQGPSTEQTEGGQSSMSRRSADASGSWAKI